MGVFGIIFLEKACAERSKENIMKKLALLFALVTVGFGIASAQLKSQVAQETQVSITRLGGDSSPLSYLFGWFDPDKFTMRHSFDMSFMTAGGHGLSLGTYTNTMMYQFDDNLNARADIAFSFSPYSSFSTFDKKDLSQVYLKNAEVNYKPWDNTKISLSFRQMPYGTGYYYSPFYSPYYYNPFYREAGF